MIIWKQIMFDYKVLSCGIIAVHAAKGYETTSMWDSEVKFGILAVYRALFKFNKPLMAILIIEKLDFVPSSHVIWIRVFVHDILMFAITEQLHSVPTFSSGASRVQNFGSQFHSKLQTPRTKWQISNCVPTILVVKFTTPSYRYTEQYISDINSSIQTIPKWAVARKDLSIVFITRINSGIPVVYQSLNNGQIVSTSGHVKWCYVYEWTKEQLANWQNLHAFSQWPPATSNEVLFATSSYSSSSEFCHWSNYVWLWLSALCTGISGYDDFSPTAVTENKTFCVQHF